VATSRRGEVSTLKIESPGDDLFGPPKLFNPEGDEGGCKQNIMGVSRLYGLRRRFAIGAQAKKWHYANADIRHFTSLFPMAEGAVLYE
jgi:hypothetical protein